ncbi:MAG: hypothetical protein JRI68_08660, partial [Deltaproteobacteria bacterium]|nr:hypothetical protein [Deltaproteobacteria bacterium]
MAGRKTIHLAGLLGISLVLGCGNHETEARQKVEEELAEHGCDDVELTASEERGHFDFEARCDDHKICSGTVTISKGLGSTSWSYNQSCALDESACTAKTPDLCKRLGDGKDQDGEPKAANGFWDKACEGGNGVACRNLALNLE